MEETLKGFDDAFQKELHSLDMELKKLIEAGKIKADELEEKPSSLIEDSKIRLKAEYEKIRDYISRN